MSRTSPRTVGNLARVSGSSPGSSKDPCRSYLVHRASAFRSHPTGRAAGCRRRCPACLAGRVNFRVGTSRGMELWALPCHCFLDFSRAAISDFCHISWHIRRRGRFHEATRSRCKIRCCERIGCITPRLRRGTFQLSEPCAVDLQKCS
jgi:hypothetical protein